MAATRARAKVSSPKPSPEAQEVSTRASWKGTLSFGLVNLPVRLAVATEERKVAFNQLHGGCGGRIRQRRVCEGCGEAVGTEEIVKGYQYEKDQYVVLDDDDFDGLPVASKKVVDVSQFVQASDIDLAMVSKTYYLLPDERSGERGYALLRSAMLAEGRWGIGKVAFRESKERLCVVRPEGGLLVMHLLFWPDEIRDASKHGTYMADVEVRKPELEMARKLVQSMAATFDPAAYTDEYRTALLSRIDAKVAGKPAPKQKAAPVRKDAGDLMDMLRASVEPRKVTKKRKGAA